MNLENMKKEELELLSYPDLTEMVLKQEGGSLNTPTIFKKICDMLEYSDEDYQNKLREAFTISKDEIIIPKTILGIVE